jgi:hypothetical protein
MDPRRLKRLLDIYREAGVVRVQLDADLRPTSLEFSPMLPVQVPAGDVEMEQGADTSWMQNAPLALQGTSLQQAYERIQATYRQQAKGKAQ